MRVGIVGLDAQGLAIVSDRLVELTVRAEPVSSLTTPGGVVVALRSTGAVP